jgi:hypothetical protein
VSPSLAAPTLPLLALALGGLSSARRVSGGCRHGIAPRGARSGIPSLGAPETVLPPRTALTRPATTWSRAPPAGNGRTEGGQCPAGGTPQAGCAPPMRGPCHAAWGGFPGLWRKKRVYFSFSEAASFVKIERRLGCLCSATFSWQSLHSSCHSKVGHPALCAPLVTTSGVLSAPREMRQGGAPSLRRLSNSQGNFRAHRS